MLRSPLGFWAELASEHDEVRLCAWKVVGPHVSTGPSLHRRRLAALRQDTSEEMLFDPLSSSYSLSCSGNHTRPSRPLNVLFANLRHNL